MGKPKVRLKLPETQYCVLEREELCPKIGEGESHADVLAAARCFASTYREAHTMAAKLASVDGGVWLVVKVQSVARVEVITELPPKDPLGDGQCES